ncbi:MAG: hypothetical protein ACP5RH_15930, partial [Leptodesmis sp.]|uniref:hypothetical protein n=1 Tax=Leptodesmis sp. TaxID=3100501 RepID=UPI003D0E9191
TAMAASTETQQFHTDSHDSHSGYGTHTIQYGGSRQLDELRALEELRKEAYYARAKEVYKEIEEFAWIDD